MVRTIGVGGQEAAAMRRNHFQPRKAIEGALEDKMRERQRRSQRIADRVGKPSVAAKSLAEFFNALRMNKQGHAEFFRLGPYRWNFGSENSTPLTTSLIAAPFKPCFFTAVSSSCTARSGACRVREAKPANRSGFD